MTLKQKAKVANLLLIASIPAAIDGCHWLAKNAVERVITNE